MVFPWFTSVSKENASNTAENDLTPDWAQPLVDITLPEFKYFTDSIEFVIPFKMTEAGLEEWFNGLNPALENYFACQQLFRALKALNAREIQPALRFAMLDFIASAIIPVVKRLEQPILQRKISLSADARRHYEIIVASYVVLAQGFALVAKDVLARRITKQTEQLLLRSLYAAMEALKKLLLYTGEAYKQPYEGFWSSCYRLYGCAEQFALLDLNIKDGTVREDSAIGYSINYSFKSLLVFYLSGLNQYRPKTMKTLLNIFMIWAPYAKIYKKIDALGSKLFFAFSLDHDAPPVFLGRFNNRTKRANDIRYLSTTEIAQIVYNNLRNETAALMDIHTMKRYELVQLVKNLSMGAHRKFMRVPENKHYSGIIGYDNILRFLRRQAGGDEESGSEALDPRIAGQWKVPELELLPLIDYEKEFGSKGWTKVANDRSGDVQTQPIWSPQSELQQDNFDTLKIVNSSVKGYGMVCAESHAKTEIGEFIGILVDDQASINRFEIGVIRRISQTETKGVSLGVELFSSTAEAVCVYNPGNVLSKRWAVLLHGIAAIKLPDSLIYDSQGIELGEEVCLVRGDTTVDARLGKSLHANGTLKHVELLIGS